MGYSKICHPKVLTLTTERNKQIGNFLAQLLEEGSRRLNNKPPKGEKIFPS
tara:strand:+ start:1016 stop:1168 length:153 start_codon:yes stop_codon:yes gene_type:complete